MSIKKNLDIQVYEKLYQEIIQGLWTQGQIINPDDFSLAYGVSRTPVVQALKRMHANEMIGVTKTGHFFVPTFTEKQVSDLIEIRALLERQAILEIENNGIELDIEALKKMADKCLSYNEEGDLIKTRQIDLDLHTYLVSQSTNQCLSNLYSKVQGQFIVANYLLATHTKQQQEVAADDHVRLLAALEEKDFTKARAISDEHIFGAGEKIIHKMRYSSRNI